MLIEVLTKEDLQLFRVQLLSDIRTMLLSMNPQAGNQKMEGFKTGDVRKVLGCSVNKLMPLRVARKIRWKKIGGTVYYNREDVKRLLEEGY
jgi:hypothetical protein